MALASEKAIGAARSKLYCARATAFTDLAAAQRVKDTVLITAGRVVAQKPEESVFVVVWKDQRAAATLLKTKNGAVLVTDDAIVADTDHPNLFAYSGTAKPVQLTATVVRRHPELSVAVLSYSEDLARPALSIAETAPAKDELVTAVGHTMISGLWTRTSGLVTKVGEVSFQTDAAISPEFSGGPVLNEAGQVAGMLVLRPADTEEARWPVAIPAPVLIGWLDDPAFAFPTAQTESIEDAGTATVLTRARAIDLTEAGLGAWNIPNLPPPPSVPNGVCVQNCGGGSSSGSSYSRGYSGSGNEELGKALGELGAVLVLKGIPALFRGMAKLFKGPGASASPSNSMSRPATVNADPSPKPVPPKLVDLDLQFDPDELIEGESLTAIALLRFTGDAPKKSGIRVTFTPSSGKRSYSAVTDSYGIAKVTIDTDSTEGDRQRPFDELKGEEQRRRGEDPATFLIPSRIQKTEVDKVKRQRAPSAFSALDREEMRYEQQNTAEVPAPGPAAMPPIEEPGPTETGASPGAILPPGSTMPPKVPRELPQPSETLPNEDDADYEEEVPDDSGRTLTVSAIAFAGSMGSAKNSGEYSVLSPKCPPGTVAPAPPETSFPGHPPTASLTKAELEGQCRPLEEIAEEICGPKKECQYGVLRVLGYDFESCFDRWKQDGEGSPGSMGQPGVPRPDQRPANRRCVPAKKAASRILPNGSFAKKGAHTGRKYDVSPGSRAAYRSMIKLLLRGARFFRDSIYLIMRKKGDINDANADFDAATNGVQRISRSRGMRTATLADGTRITVRPFSADGAPTLEVIGPNGELVKIRYK